MRDLSIRFETASAEFSIANLEAYGELMGLYSMLAMTLPSAEEERYGEAVEMNSYTNPANWYSS